jgi:FG-GAP-like repeat
MDVTRVFDLQATFGDTGDAFSGVTFSGTLTIDVTAGSVKAINVTIFDASFTSVDLSSSEGDRWRVISIDQISGITALDLSLDTRTLVGFGGGRVDGDQTGGDRFTGSLTPSLSSPAGDLFLIADHDTTRTVIAPLQTSQVIAVVGSNVAFDGAGDFNNDGLSDLLAHTDAGGVRTLFAYQMTPEGSGGASTVGNLGTDWSTDAFGDFNGDGTMDILLHRDSGSTRTFEALSMNNYTVQSASIIQVAGIDWNIDGTGDFNHDHTSDLLEHRIVGGNMDLLLVTLHQSDTNVVQSASLLGTVGSDWQIDGMGDLNHDGTSDILMHHDTADGVRTLEILTINNNTLVGGTVVARVGTDFQVDRIGDFNADGTSDIVMHADSGTTRNHWIFTVENNVVTNAHIVATTGIEWQPGGFAADPPTGSMGSAGSTSQLVQAMAGFGGGSGAGESSNTARLGAETSQQPLLTTPQHA